MVLRRHAPLLVFAICTAVLVWAVERQRYTANAATLFEIFGTTVLAIVILRNYAGPDSFNSDLPRVAGVITAVVLSLAFVFLIVAVIMRIRQ